jgi:hypothetical protein
LTAELRGEFWKIVAVFDERVEHVGAKVQTLELSSRCLRPVINADAHEMYVLHAESIAPFLHLLRDRAASSSPRVVKVNHSGRPSDGFGETDPFHPRAVRRELDHVEFGASRPDESHRRPSTRSPSRAASRSGRTNPFTRYNQTTT